MYATDVRQTDVRRASSLNVPAWGIMIEFGMFNTGGWGIAYF